MLQELKQLSVEERRARNKVTMMYMKVNNQIAIDPGLVITPNVANNYRLLHGLNLYFSGIFTQDPEFPKT